ncbi:MAG: hypothetical protein Kow0092_33840 [Deferrisomatales bacterium]
MPRETSQPGVVKRFPDPDGALWARFAEADTPESFCACWLALQCRRIDGVRGGLVLLGEADRGPFTAAAVWPDARRSMQHLTGAAEQALTERRGLFLRSPPSPDGDPGQGEACHVAYPVEVDGRLHGVVVLDVEGRSDAGIQAALRELYWGTAWLELLFRRKGEGEAADARDRLITVLDLLACCVEPRRFQAAATALVTEVAGRLGCERVSFGVLRRGRIRVRALSHSADFGKRMNLIHAVAAAMEEAVDQAAVIVHPEPPDGEPYVSRAHGELARRYGAGAVCTVPVLRDGEPVGALTLERGEERPFDPGERELCESLASLAGPVLEDKRREDRWLVAKAATAAYEQLERLVGPRHVGRKLLAAAAVALALFFSVAQGDYRVAATASLEGAVQRALVAPFQGYVLEAHARAGDVVREGEVLAALDDRDLSLERLKWASQREQLAKKYREALAGRDRAQVRIVGAQIAQAEAQLALLDEQLARTRLRAPFDAVVVSGDLSQSLGAPVERGEVLFEVAPLDDYRVVLEVDERDIDQVRPAQEGTLVLAALPQDPLPFTVEKITPVSTAREGKNFFRVEARLQTPSDRLRPGMEGVGKIDIDRRKLLWIWTHQAVDWLRLKLWSWWP